MTRVLVASASAVVRKGLEALVRASASLKLVGASAASAAALGEQIEETAPDVVLLEWKPVEEEPAPVLLELNEGGGAPALVLLTDAALSAGAAEALRRGARAVLPRDADAHEIVAAIQAAAAGLVALRADAIDALLPAAAHSSRPLAAHPVQPLSPREVEVLGLLAEGLGNKEIAWRLGLSEHTVKFHISSIFTKLDAGSRTEAVTLGARLGLIML